MMERARKISGTEQKERTVINGFVCNYDPKDENPLEWILVINYGTELIDGLIQLFYKMGTNVLVLDYEEASDETVQAILNSHFIKGIVLSGSTNNSVFKVGAPQVNPCILDGSIPVLAICYGTQTIAWICGCNVKENPSGEDERGPTKLKIIADSKLWKGLDKDRIFVWMYHTYCPSSIPQGFKHTASTKDCPYAAFELDNIYCVHFHPEYTFSISGTMIIRNFLTLICGLDTYYF
jgi:GMP synthase (glutamine-hydrolysing)